MTCCFECHDFCVAPQLVADTSDLSAADQTSSVPENNMVAEILVATLGKDQSKATVLVVRGRRS
jgi:hypothetical protein